MTGGIYSREKCPECGGSFIHDERRKGLFCPDHPHQEAKTFFVRFKSVHRRFGKDYEGAVRFLTGLRFKTDEGSFDPRDYRADNPLSIDKLLDEWIGKKAKKLRPGTMKNYRAYYRRASARWGDLNIKAVGFPEIDDFIEDLGEELKPKTVHNILLFLKEFWSWAHKRYRTPLPEDWPVTTPDQMGFRKTIDLETQEAVIRQIRLDHPNPRMWIAIKLLATYISIRPGELRLLDEGHINRDRGLITVPPEVNKTKDLKIVPLTPADLSLINTLPRGLDHVPFCRHDILPPHQPEGILGQRFGPRQLYRVWKSACARFGIEGVDLYGGTKHSTARAMLEAASPERIMRGTGHKSNKAFRRYLEVTGEELIETYSIREALVKESGKGKKVVSLASYRDRKSED